MSTYGKINTFIEAKILRFFIDTIEDKYPHHWALPDSNGVHTVKKSKPSDTVLAEIITKSFGYECTAIDVHMARGKHKERNKILKACSKNPEDMLEMVNHYRDKDDYVVLRRIIKQSKGIKTPTLEIIKYLIAKGDIFVK